MRTKLLIFLFFAGILTPNLIFAQFVQQGPKLVGNDVVGSSFQGSSVAISSDGNTAIVGGAGDNNLVGSVWVFTRSGGVWTQQGQKLVGTGMIGNAQQGFSADISSDGNTAIVGGPLDNNGVGAVWIFTRSGGVWTQQGQKLVGTGVIGNAQQGYSVAISSDGNTAIVGGDRDNNLVGAAWVFTRNGGVWTQQGTKLIGTGAVGNAQQGISVAISSDGNTALVGGNFDNSRTGAVWVFTRSGGVWTQQSQKLVGTGAIGNGEQGWRVDVSSDGNTAIVGSPVDNSEAGAVWIFIRNGSVWTQQGPKLVGNDAIGNVLQGRSVSISSDGNTAIVGGPLDNNNVGAFWVFTRNGDVWTQQGSKLVGTGANGIARQGISVAISSDGNTLIEGGWNDNSNVGAAWLFYNTITEVKNERIINNNYSLEQNYPNPFNPSTKIRYEIPDQVRNDNILVTLKVYDVLGNEVATLVNEEKPVGTYEVDFNATNLTSGVYFYKLQANDFVQTKKMVLLR